MKEISRQWSYAHFNAEYGTVTCTSDGAIRDMFDSAIEDMELPKEVDSALQMLCKAIYEHTGTLPSVNIAD